MIAIRRARELLSEAPVEAAGDAIGLVAMVAMVAAGFALPAFL